MHHVRNMRGRLMIIHGLIDENVLPFFLIRDEILLLIPDLLQDGLSD